MEDFKVKLDTAYLELSNNSISTIANLLSSIEKNGSSINILHILDGLSSIFAKQVGLKENAFIEKAELCNKVIADVEQDGDVVEAMVTVIKLCTEILVKIELANRLKENQ